MSQGERSGPAGNASSSAVLAPAPMAAAPDATAAPIRSELLLGGAREVQIEHRGVIYRLKQTALGKLILTK